MELHLSLGYEDVYISVKKSGHIFLDIYFLHEKMWFDFFSGETLTNMFCELTGVTNETIQFYGASHYMYESIILSSRCPDFNFRYIN